MSTPKNGFLVLTVKPDGIEEVVLQTADGEVILQLRTLDPGKARLALKAPKSVKINRRKQSISNGGQGRQLSEGGSEEVRAELRSDIR